MRKSKTKTRIKYKNSRNLYKKLNEFMLKRKVKFCKRRAVMDDFKTIGKREKSKPTNFSNNTSKQ